MIFRRAYLSLLFDGRQVELGKKKKKITILYIKIKRKKTLHFKLTYFIIQDKLFSFSILRSNVQYIHQYS